MDQEGPDMGQDVEPIPNESTVIATVIASTGGPALTLAERGAMGHHGSDDYSTCMQPTHWERVPAGVLADDLLADEIEMDLL